MNRAACVLCVVGVAGVGAVLLGAGQNTPSSAPSSAPTVTLSPGSAVNGAPTEHTLTIPGGNSYTMLAFTNSGAIVVNARIVTAAGDLAFKVPANSTMTFPLGAPTSMWNTQNTQVKYTVSGGNGQPAGGLTGWGVADGKLVAFATDTTKGTQPSQPSGPVKPNR